MNYKKILICIILIISILLIMITMNKVENKDYQFKIYFFNAGKADAILISNNNKYIMIDTGEESLSSEILSYFRNNNITCLDYLIITHFDKDHVGSASAIIDNIEVKNVFQSNVPKDSAYYNNYINSLENKNISAQTISGEYQFLLEDLNIVVNGPTEVFDTSESNNSSLIISIQYKETNYLFMGDAENARIKDFISQNSNSYQLIKMPYHGNYLKRLNELLENTSPNYAVITSSDEMLEDEETIELLEKFGIECYLTRKGSLTILSDGKKIIIKQSI